MRLRLIVLLAAIILLSNYSAFSQTCTTASNDSNYTFFVNCEAGSNYTLTGNYSITVRNGTTLKINGNITINGTLTITLQSNSGLVEILNGFTLTATNLIFAGNPNPKSLIVNGPSGALVVPGTLDFGGRAIDIDGTGTITAGTVTGGGSTTCSSDGSCPTFTATNCTGGGICTGQGLPVTLSSFVGRTDLSRIALSWSTASELNFDYFDVERSADAIDFMSIGKVTGHGTSNVRNDYSLVDEKPLIGKNYYRLKSVDFDYYTEYFKVIAVDFSGEKSFMISPNPSDGTSLGFSLNFTPYGNSKIIIFDNLSNIVGEYDPSDYSQSISFTNPLKGGIYYAKIISDDFVKVERFVVR